MSDTSFDKNKVFNLDQTAKLFKVLGDKNRLKIVYSLREKQMCVCELTQCLNISQSLVSHQLKILREQKIVKCERNKNHIFYKLDDKHIEEIVDMAKVHILEQENESEKRN